MQFARRSVSDADIRKYQAFAQTLQQVGGWLGGWCSSTWHSSPQACSGWLMEEQPPHQLTCLSHSLSLSLCLPLPLLSAPQSRGFGSEFRFPDAAGGVAPAAAGAAAPAAAAGTFASAGAADEDDDLYS